MGILKNLPKSVVQVLVFFHNVVNTLKTAKQVSDFFHNAVNISKIVMQQKKSNSSSSNPGRSYSEFANLHRGNVYGYCK